MDFQHVLSTPCDACYASNLDRFLSEWLLARTLDGFVQLIRGIQVCLVGMLRLCFFLKKKKEILSFSFIWSEIVNVKKRRTVKRVFRRVVLQQGFRSIGRPSMLCDHYIMAYPNKHRPIDRDEHALLLQQHLKRLCVQLAGL